MSPLLVLSGLSDPSPKWPLLDKSGQLAPELFCNHRCRLRLGKIPTQMVLIVLAATKSETSFAAHGMKVMLSIEPLAKAAQRHRNLDDVREFPLNSFGAWSSASSARVTDSLA
jgi:hypothetical protein